MFNTGYGDSGLAPDVGFTGNTSFNPAGQMNTTVNTNLAGGSGGGGLWSMIGAALKMKQETKAREIADAQEARKMQLAMQKLQLNQMREAGRARPTPGYDTGGGDGSNIRRSDHGKPSTAFRNQGPLAYTKVIGSRPGLIGGQIPLTRWEPGADVAGYASDLGLRTPENATLVPNYEGDKNPTGYSSAGSGVTPASPGAARPMNEYETQEAERIRIENAKVKAGQAPASYQYTNNVRV